MLEKCVGKCVLCWKFRHRLRKYVGISGGGLGNGGMRCLGSMLEKYVGGVLEKAGKLRKRLK